jgi:tRNA-2-methylthio-N6-dimethylallyladenosine synthase
VLAAMNRGHSRDDYLAIIKRARNARPDIAISSDFIIGFPGESDEDFAATLEIVERVGFAQAYSFKYSARPGTPAASLDQVPDAVKIERLARLQALIDAGLRKFNAASIGSTLDVLFEKPGKLAGQLVGRSPYLQPVQVMAPVHLIGTIAPVTILDVGQYSLYGALSSTMLPRSCEPAVLAAAGGA